MVIDEEGESLGVLSKSEALSIAEEKGLDLVEVGPSSKPPVCKILDYGKFKYEQEKKHQKGKSKAGEIKEIRFSVTTEEHDFTTKIEKARKFIEKGHKIRVTVKMSGRENIYSQKAIDQIERVKQELEMDYEQNPTRMGNRISATLIRKKG